MNIRDSLAYLTMIPMVAIILISLGIIALLGSTAVAGTVIGLAELLHSIN